MSEENKQQPKSKYVSATEKQWDECAAGWNCWLRRGKSWCAICGVGDEKGWRKECDAARKASGMPSYAELLEMGKALVGK